MLQLYCHSEYIQLMQRQMGFEKYGLSFDLKFTKCKKLEASSLHFKPLATQKSPLSSISVWVGKLSEGLQLQQKGGNQSNKDEQGNGGGESLSCQSCFIPQRRGIFYFTSNLTFLLLLSLFTLNFRFILAIQ